MKTLLRLMGALLLAGSHATVAAPILTDLSSFSRPAIDIDAPVGTPLTNQFAGSGLVISGGASANTNFGMPAEAGAISGASLMFGPPTTLSGAITFSLNSSVNLFGGYFSWNPTRVLQIEIGRGAESLGSISLLNDRPNSAPIFVGISDSTPFDRVQITALADGVVGRTSFQFDLLRFEPFAPVAVPEPSTFALLSLGMGALGFGRVRRRPNRPRAGARFPPSVGRGLMAPYTRTTRRACRDPYPR